MKQHREPGLKAQTLREARLKLKRAGAMMAMGQYKAALPMIESAQADLRFVQDQNTMDRLLMDHEARSRVEIPQPNGGNASAA
jgi:hypothetical protein